MAGSQSRDVERNFMEHVKKNKDPPMSALGQGNKEAPQLCTSAGWKRMGRRLLSSEQRHLGEEE